MQKFVHDIKFTKPKIKCHAFSTNIGEKMVLYQVIQLKDSIIIFINEKNNLNLEDLSLAMINRYETLPISTQLFGNFLSDTSKTIASHACKKLNKCVYVSCNIEYDKLIFPYIEKCLYNEMKRHPNKF